MIGRGNVGGTLGERLASAGHDVVFGVRTPGGAGTASVGDAVAGAEAVVLAVPGPVAGGLVAGLGAALDGKVVVDATNNLSVPGPMHALAGLGEKAYAVRAFNTVGWEVLADPIVDGRRTSLVYAAEEGPGRDVAEQLVRGVGLDPVWAGGADAFDIVDGLARLWLTLVLRRGHPRRLAFGVLAER